jgi:hypothetical protein
MQNGEGSSKTRCNLAPPGQPLQIENEENRYTHNFKGEFCRCGRDYDPETETEAMIHCMGCEVSHISENADTQIVINLMGVRIGIMRAAST